MPCLIDTHAHLNDPQFDRDLDQVLSRAWNEGIIAVVTVGYDLKSSERAVELAAGYDRIFAAVGIHPNYSSEVTEPGWRRIEDLTSHGKVVAIGETGLDFYRDFAPPETQQASFQKQLELAERLNLPVIVHSRNAAKECLEIISAVGSPKVGGVMHCFEGTPDQASNALELGMYISANGMATWDNRTDIREMLKVVPLDRLLIETDAPYLAPKPIGRKRNEPAHVRHVAECLAGLFDVTADELAERTASNAIKLFIMSGATK